MINKLLEKYSIGKKKQLVKELFYSKAFMLYFVLNTLMVWGFILFLFSLEQKMGMFHFAFFFVSLIVIIAQYIPIKNAKSWIKKIWFYYLSMILYLFILGVVLSWNHFVGSNPAGSWLARLDGGIRMVVFGQITVMIFFPVFPIIILINWLFRKETALE